MVDVLVFGGTQAGLLGCGRGAEGKGREGGRREGRGGGGKGEEEGEREWEGEGRGGRGEEERGRGGGESRELRAERRREENLSLYNVRCFSPDHCLDGPAHGRDGSRSCGQAHGRGSHVHRDMAPHN